MLVIASNITTRDARINRFFRELKAASWNTGNEPAQKIAELAKQCVAAGAECLEINIQQHHDRPEAMEFTVKAVQKAAGRQLCLSTNNAGALEAGLKACKLPPLVNYVSVEESRLKEMLPLVSLYKAHVILLVSDASAPDDAREMLEKAAILVGAANEVGIPNDRILVDPGIIHITSDIGQRHLAETAEFLKALPGVFDPPVRSVGWIANASAGAPTRLRSAIELTLLPLLAGLGLSAAFLDMMKWQNMRTARLLKIFENQAVYSDDALEMWPALKSIGPKY